MRLRQSGVWNSDALREALSDLASDPAPKPGAAAELGRRFGKFGNGIYGLLSILRATPRQPGWTWEDHYKAALRAAYARRKQAASGQDGAAGVCPARACGPERASATSGHDAGGVPPARIASGVSSLNLDARGESRAVASAAGEAFRVDAAPAAEFWDETPGRCWAREVMAKGLPLAKVLSAGGDRLTWRDRAALRAGMQP